MKILFCSSEVLPFAKTGGLADVVGALPIALEHQGHEVRISLPKYKEVKEKSDSATLGKGIKVHFIKNDKLYMRDGLYGDKKGDHKDNLERFAFYCKETLKLMKKEGFKPDIIHCHDWQTGLIPAYLKTIYKDDLFFKNTKTVFTIHNLAYTGTFPEKEWPQTSLDKALFNAGGLEYCGRFSLLKSGLVFSDLLTTVSPTYANEIQTEEFGCGMESILKQRDKDLYGILNGIDYEIWDPAKDRFIYKNYTSDSIEGKYINKEKLTYDLGIKIGKGTPLLAAVGRLAYQKGYDMLAEIVSELCDMDIGFVLLGTGEQRYHKIFEEIALNHKSNLSVNLKFDAALAQKIYAASDIFLMPSRYEPCGLGQLISFKYGTVTVARKTGGLADTISEFDPVTEEGNGFLFKACDSRQLLEVIKRAIDAYKDKEKWLRLVKKIAEYDFSWDRSAEEYTKIYERLIGLKV